MSKFLITYDLKADHVKVKNALKSAGWKDTIQGNGATANLPNTTLWGEFTSTATSLREGATKIIHAETAPSNLERLIVVQFDNWAALIGKPF